MSVVFGNSPFPTPLSDNQSLLHRQTPIELTIHQPPSPQPQFNPNFNPLPGPGGNQRELAREKAQKKQASVSKGKNKEDGLTLSQRKERDAQIMREKQQKKEAEKNAPTAQK